MATGQCSAQPANACICVSCVFTKCQWLDMGCIGRLEGPRAWLAIKRFSFIYFSFSFIFIFALRINRKTGKAVLSRIQIKLLLLLHPAMCTYRCRYRCSHFGSASRQIYFPFSCKIYLFIYTRARAMGMRDMRVARRTHGLRMEQSSRPYLFSSIFVQSSVAMCVWTFCPRRRCHQRILLLNMDFVHYFFFWFFFSVLFSFAIDSVVGGLVDRGEIVNNNK